MADDNKIEGVSSETQENNTNSGAEGKPEKFKLTTEEFLSAVKEAGLEDSLKDYLTREADRRVTEAIKTHDKKLREEMEKKKQEEQKNNSTNSTNPLEQEIKELKEKLESLSKFQSEYQKKTWKEQVRTALKNAGLKEDLAEYLHVEEGDTEHLEQAVNMMKEHITTLAQDKIDKMIQEGSIPAQSTSGTPAEENITQFAEELNKGAAGAIEGIKPEEIQK